MDPLSSFPFFEDFLSHLLFLPLCFTRSNRQLSGLFYRLRVTTTIEMYANAKQLRTNFENRLLLPHSLKFFKEINKQQLTNQPSQFIYLNIWKFNYYHLFFTLKREKKNQIIYKNIIDNVIIRSINRRVMFWNH